MAASQGGQVEEWRCCSNMGLEEGVLNTFLVLGARCDHLWWQRDLGVPSIPKAPCFLMECQAFLLVVGGKGLGRGMA